MKTTFCKQFTKWKQFHLTMYNYRIVSSIIMSQTSPDKQTTGICSLKWKISPVGETEKSETSPVVHNENNSKRCKLDESSRPGLV